MSLTNEIYKKFWDYKQDDNKFKSISNERKPVLGREQALYIAGILCENLRICIKKAKLQLPHKSMNIDNIIKI